jgi:hypothetical protein
MGYKCKRTRHSRRVSFSSFSCLYLAFYDHLLVKRLLIRPFFRSNIRAYLPTKRSIEERLKLAKHHGMGIFIWEIGQGLDDFITVL